jgi:glycosyltransferase involved in cell wall biosynthesis
MASHVLLITVLKKTDEEIITGKIFEYLASGKKILMISDDGYVPRLIRQLDRGDVIKETDIKGISNVIYSYFSDFKKNKFFHAKPINVVQFDRRKLTGELASVLDRIIK